MDDLHQLVGPAFLVLFFALGLALAAFSIVGTWKMFEKADQPGWGILVPIYNAILLVRIAVGVDGVVSVQARQTLDETEALLNGAERHDFFAGITGPDVLRLGD